MDEITPAVPQPTTETLADPVVADAVPVPRAALLRNIATVLLLFGIPVLGELAVWTIAPWDRRGRIVVSIVFAPYAAFSLYRMCLILFALGRAAFA